jgi:hypothetical protein
LHKHILSFHDTQVAVFEWCIMAGSRVNYPSKLSELIGEGMTEFPRRLRCDGAHDNPIPFECRHPQSPSRGVRSSVTLTVENR